MGDKKEEEEVVNDEPLTDNSTDDAIDKEVDTSLLKILDVNKKYFKYFKIYGTELTLILNNDLVQNHRNQLVWLEKCFDQLVNYLTSKFNQDDFIGLTFSSENFERGWVSFRRISEFSSKNISDLLYSVVQSNKAFDIKDKITINCNIVKDTRGKGRVKCSKDNTRKKSIITIKNDDNLCFPRSLVVAKAHADLGHLRSGDLYDFWMNIRKTGTVQTLEVEKLIKDACVKIPEDGCGHSEFVKFQDYYAQFGIAIIIYSLKNFTAKNCKPIFDGKEIVINHFGSVKFKLNILYYDDEPCHFEPITNMKAALAVKYLCNLCDTPYSSSHKCEFKCIKCLETPPCKKNDKKAFVKCEFCNRIFYNQTCFENHKKLKSDYLISKEATLENIDKLYSLCDKLKVCGKCFKKQESGHECNKIFCKTCYKEKDINHFCFIQPLKDKSIDNEKILYVFYDFESRQEDVINDKYKSRIHVPNLCVLQHVCTYCINDEDLSELCGFCGKREQVFKINPVKQFVEYVFREVTDFNKIICIAHNSKGYDAQFILQYLVEDLNVRPELILNGTSVIQLRLRKTVLIDSLNYFHMPLSKLPKAFGLQEVKGYFPHLFNKIENQNYISKIPDIEFYSPNTMGESEREQFMKWHSEMRKQKYVFNFKEEIVKYCKLDVEILRRACLAFRKIFLDNCNVCPFRSSCTIASACNRLFR